MTNTIATPVGKDFAIPEFTISFKYKTQASEKYVIRTSGDVASVAKKCFDADTIEWVESLLVIALSRNKKVLGFYKISQGGVYSTVVDPRVIMQFALLTNSTELIMAHNPPIR